MPGIAPRPSALDVDELLARVCAALRRRPEPADRAAIVRAGNVEIDRVRQRATKGGDVHLTPTELRFLELLVRSDGRLVTYADAARQIPASGKLGDDAADPSVIVTHFGLGYRWIAGDNDDSG